MSRPPQGTTAVGAGAAKAMGRIVALALAKNALHVVIHLTSFSGPLPTTRKGEWNFE
jgi:hypothetical protein